MLPDAVLRQLHRHGAAVLAQQLDLAHVHAEVAGRDARSRDAHAVVALTADKRLAVDLRREVQRHLRGFGRVGHGAAGGQCHGGGCDEERFHEDS